MWDRIKSVFVLAAPCGTIGGFLYSRGYTRSGWTLIGIAILIVTVAIVSIAVPALVQVLLWVSAPLRWVASLTWKFAARTLSRAKQKMRTYFSDGGPMYDFVAHRPRAYMHSQQADYKLIPKPEGSEFRGLGVVIRPDYQFDYWRAGFRLVRAGEDLSHGDISDTVLFHIAIDQLGGQPYTAIYVRRRQQLGAINSGNVRWPSFRISANVWPVPNAPKLRMSVVVEAPNSSPVEVEFDTGDMESVALIAWGDGGPFRVSFDDVKIYSR